MEQTNQPTPEDMAQRRADLKKFYEDSIPFLESQLAYEKLKTQIAKEKFEQFKCDFSISQAMAPAPEGEPEKNPAENLTGNE